MGVLLVTTALCVERMGLPTSTGARLSVIRWRFSAKDLVLALRNQMERKTKFKMEVLKVLYLIKMNNWTRQNYHKTEIPCLRFE